MSSIFGRSRSTLSSRSACWYLSRFTGRHLNILGPTAPKLIPLNRSCDRLRSLKKTDLMCTKDDDTHQRSRFLNSWSQEQSGTRHQISRLELLEIGEKKKQEEVDDTVTFADLFIVLLKDLTDAGLIDEDTTDAFKWFKRVSEYNVGHGKLNRGLTVVQSFRLLADSHELTEEGRKRAGVVGWCLEWFGASILVVDDIMDASITRWGQPCWYKVDGVGLKAINDSFFLESATFFLLKKYLRDTPYYMDIVDLFHEMTLQTITGQTLDMITAPTDHVDFTLYTLKRFKAMAKYKTALYSFYVPVACAMYMVGIKDQQSHEEAKVILLAMGELYQIQNDFLDCYGDPATTGKIGTDIEDNKCTWLIVHALLTANKEQMAVLQENYGRHDSECVRNVKKVYSELKLPELHANLLESSYSELLSLINKVTAPLPKEIFKALSRKIYK